ncbi:TPA: ATP-binding protein, partial [Enterococcus faecium]|nr:ATP-binding protein [Enterococcus faecium]
MQSQIVDIRMYSYNFPDKIYCEIKRDNLIDSLEEMATVNDVVFVTGNSGMGKTVLLKQFCEKFNAISLF